MAEIIPLIQKLATLLIDEGNFISEVKPEVESLRKDLLLMTASLKDADAAAIQLKNERAKEWVKQLRELAFEVEDAIDVFVYKMARKQRHNSIVQKITKFPKDLIYAHKLREKIQVIKGKLKKHFEHRTNYEIRQFEEGQSQISVQAHQLEASNSPNVEVVGFQKEAEELAKLLTKQDLHGQLRVVSITGMGGLGKTTLARKIYERDDVRRHFNCQAWIYISKEYKFKDVLHKIIEQVMMPTEEERVKLLPMEEGDLEKKLFDFLREKNYFFVVDDIWTKEDWDKLRRIFPAPSNSIRQRRVLLTTRDEVIPRYADEITLPYKLQLLDEEKSLELFLNVVFRSVDREAILNKEMKNLAEKIVAKCDRLPLAIVVMGGLLSTKRPTIFAWRNVLESVDWFLDSSVCHKALALSYSELPNHLKPCFLYFGLFPLETEIKRDRLIRLWVAEGFLEPRGKLRMEEVGGECLEELMQRNLIEVAKWKPNQVPDSFIIHDLLLNLAASKAKEGNFLNTSTSKKSLKSYRRVALHGEESDEITAAPYPSLTSNLLRSLLSFTEITPSLCGKFKLLNVLDLEGVPGIESLPKEIGKLICLKYLNLSETNLKTVPSWLGNLYNLQTLNLYNTKIGSVPIEIYKLEKLRHLLCFNRNCKGTSDDFVVQSSVGVFWRRPSPRHIHQLKDLHTLWFHISSWIEDGLENLTNLRELGITGFGELMKKFGEALSRALAKLVLLEVLFLAEQAWLGLGEIILPSFSDHQYLHDITIIGAGILKLPDLKNFPPHLTRLRLGSTHLMEDMMQTLEKLPQLKDLKLDSHPYDGVEMKCSSGGFSKLENLSLIWFDWLISWKVEEGAMPNLRTLEMNHLLELKWMPEGMRNIATLEKLSLSMPNEFLERVKEGGEDWEKIEHVPSINIREVQIPTEISQHIAESEQERSLLAEIERERRELAAIERERSKIGKIERSLKHVATFLYPDEVERQRNLLVIAEYEAKRSLLDEKEGSLLKKIEQMIPRQSSAASSIEST
ncbi:hypothetical protein NE237_010857 [Protea cynaroides]|uniref:Disease resistance protein n=1 Tax=Protea cynaroides TaxID=273540 RepID=A0A9Q0L057_9MAGN|nr:hypothetical protein NE237_010857 [Protea cynaroides]